MPCVWRQGWRGPGWRVRWKPVEECAMIRLMFLALLLVSGCGVPFVPLI